MYSVGPIMRLANRDFVFLFAIRRELIDKESDNE